MRPTTSGDGTDGAGRSSGAEDQRRDRELAAEHRAHHARQFARMLAMERPRGVTLDEAEGRLSVIELIAEEAARSPSFVATAFELLVSDARAAVGELRAVQAAERHEEACRLAEAETAAAIAAHLHGEGELTDETPTTYVESMRGWPRSRAGGDERMPGRGRPKPSGTWWRRALGALVGVPGVQPNEHGGER